MVGLHHPVRVVIGGAGALILSNDLQRATLDCDVLVSQPDMGQLQDVIREVAERLGLVGGWLYGSAQAFADILPPGYEARLNSLPPFGRLQVMVVHRKDVIVMKLFAGRPRDLIDVKSLSPTLAEINFARDQLPRLRVIDFARATRMGKVLDEFTHARD